MYPDMSVNPRFAEELRAQGIKPGQPLYFLCRSGARSRAAAKAMTAAGFAACYNVAGGFEGDLDAEKHRSRLGGWKATGLARSEEHTSELQSLMRISYAVFCLKKKNKTNHRRDV